VELVYHYSMRVPRQDNSEKISGPEVGTGRVNQKRRTRAAIVDAAKALMEEGTTPTVAQAAEAALVSRTTAYRYFPTQESLLLEIAVDVDVDDIDELVARPLDDGEDAVTRTVAVLDLFNRHVLDDETRYRTALRLYLDLWLAAVASGDDAPVVRVGRRRRWFADALAPLKHEIDDDALERLVAGLSLLGGGEAIFVLRDVCRLTPDEALAVTDWAARALVAATLDE
jgi:AcrR family transcriptional regulator